MAIDALSAARTMCEARSWSITNLTLQKLLYISEMIWFGDTKGKDSLVNATFQAWDYGPVLPDVYHRAKAFGDNPVRDVFHISDTFSGKKRDFIYEVSNAFLDYSPFDLVEYTHWPSGAWAKNYVPGVPGIVIQRSDILAEYAVRTS